MRSEFMGQLAASAKSFLLQEKREKKLPASIQKEMEAMWKSDVIIPIEIEQHFRKLTMEELESIWGENRGNPEDDENLPF